MKSIQFTAYGNPAEVVKLVDVPDIGMPGPDEIVIDMEAAPIEPSRFVHDCRNLRKSAAYCLTSWVFRAWAVSLQ